MKSTFQSFWFWILLLGLLLILIGALIAGGTKQFSGWVWGLFIVGIVMALIGLLIGILSWNSNKNIGNVLPCPKITEMQVNEGPGCNSPSRLENSYIPNLSTNTSLNTKSPSINENLSRNISSSPPMVPTKVSTNIPQAQRGFATTSLNLSALSPNS